MRIERQPDGSFLISEAEPPFNDVLRSIPACAEADDNDAARERIFPRPIAGKGDDELCEEWREFVQPGLRHLFEDAIATVESDLEQLEGDETTLTIPALHVDAWLNALNQVRLVLAARFEVTEEDMNRRPRRVESERDFAVFQIDFFAFIQENLLYEE